MYYFRKFCWYTQQIKSPNYNSMKEHKHEDKNNNSCKEGK